MNKISVSYTFSYFMQKYSEGTRATEAPTVEASMSRGNDFVGAAAVKKPEKKKRVFGTKKKAAKETAEQDG